jgi:signal transduction histidine kinase
MLDGIAQALRSPFVAVVTEGEEVAVVGAVDEGHPVHHVPLDYAGRPVGELLIATRTERDRLGRSHRGLVAALSGPVAAAVDASRAAKELNESRARVLNVRETERTRLRADLHDGIGPSLSGVSLGLEAALGAVGTSPGRATEILRVVHREVDSLVSEVRDIIDDLGPTNVDLLGSLRSQVETIASTGVEVHLRHGDTPIGAPPAVLAAAQRIAGEALSNAVRHADASCIEVCVSDEADTLVVEVRDDGCGTVAPRPGGVGLTSMRERADAVGGTLIVETIAGSGTVVRAVLPATGLA